MQQEAAERVREMQRRARHYVEDDRSVEEKADAVQDKRLEASPEKNLCAPHKPAVPLARFGQDKEQLFLLMLAVLLVRNDAPIELVLALLYLSL